MKKQYQLPQTKVMKVQQTEIICSSPSGQFGINKNKVEEGSESDWSDTNLDW